MIELRGAPVAEAIRLRVGAELARLTRPPRLVSLVDPLADDAMAYSRQQRRACERLGISFVEHEIGSDATTLVEQLNADPATTAIFLHEPAPEGLRGMIDPAKDPENPVPCTAAAVLELLDFYNVQLDRAHVVVIGRSPMVGRPVVSLLLDRRPGPTVIVCHSGTRDLAQHTSRADIVVAAAGSPKLVDTVAKGVVIIDVGTNVVGDRLIGDVNEEAVAGRCSALTPVPGGIGPVTVACLLRNVVRDAATRSTP